IKRQCVENEFDRNPKYREMILDTIMEDQELTSVMIGGFIARETGKDTGGTLEFNRRFVLDNKFKNSEHTARISTTSRGDIRDEKNNIRDDYGYFRYDISKVENDD
ncbi:MAG: hypothetical protein ACRCXX_11210, partial [Cetobacterium sp.]|uniref:hypothetical protein n=1 Tax=Cetobacterium sp. TaxID=2071632 RepID=UPI003F40C805